jgi:hypothetical protein
MNIEEFLKSTGRKSLLAEECGPSEGGNLLSCQGAPLAAPNEKWPEKDGETLLPILSIYTPELPFVPSFLQSHIYWSIFIEADSYDQALNDGSLVVRRYSDVAGLEEPEDPEYSFGPRLRFREVIDYPCYDAIMEALETNADLLAAYEERSEILMGQYPCHSGIKLGGYPQLIQGVAFLRPLNSEYEIQLDSTEYYSYADTGIGFLYEGLSGCIWESM